MTDLDKGRSREAANPRSPRGEAGTDKYGRNFPRAAVSDVDYQLSVPEGLIPEGMKPYWFSDHIVGRIQQKIKEWWVPVVDPSTNEPITQQSGEKRLHLMMIEQELYDEDERLRESQYRASVGEVLHNPNLGDGIETYESSGSKNQIKVSKDRDVFI